MVEFAVALPLLMLLLLGLIEYGRLAYFTIQVGNAAHAGAQYGSLSSTNGADLSGMRQAALKDGQNALATLTATANDVCTCWNGTVDTPSPPAASACGANCGANGRPVTYAQVTVAGNLAPLFDYSKLGLPAAWAVSRTAMIRVLK